MNLVVYVAVHKPYEMPGVAPYQPIHVGQASARTETQFPGDDSGDNISEKNPTYCELTALYWIWKNTTHDAYGLVHYRRYFAGSGWRGVATDAEIRGWLDGADVVVAKRRRYYIETIRSHYARAHHESDLDVARDVISGRAPEYLTAFDAVMNQRSLSLFNMFVMRRELLDGYCEWLFPILADVEGRVDLDSYAPQQARVIGYLAERLFNVWFTHHTELRVRRVKVVSLEGENYVKKASGMLKRRFGRGRAH